MTIPSPAALCWPAPERNKEPICEVLRTHVLPRLSPRQPAKQPLVVEIASGSGQHVAHFASHFEGLRFLPTDIEAAHLESVRAWRETLPQETAQRIEDPIELNVLHEPAPRDDVAGMLCANMIHIAPWSATEGLMRHAQAWLTEGAPLLLYGPFRRDGRHTSESNEAFDLSLKSRDPSWGVRDLEAVEEVARARGLRLEAVTQMPANNLCVLFVRDR